MTDDYLSYCVNTGKVNKVQIILSAVDKGDKKK